MSEYKDVQESKPSVPFLNEATVVDSDVHTAYMARELVDKRAEYLDEPYRSVLKSRDTFGVNSYPSSNFPLSMPDKLNVIRDDHEAEDPITDIEEPLTRFGVDYAVINTLVKIDLVPERERAVQEMRATNNVLLEHFLEPSEKLFGLALLTTRDPDAAAEEIERMSGENKIVGAIMLNGASEKPLGAPRYDPIYRAAEDNDMPIAFHTSGAGFPAQPNFPVPTNAFEKYLPVHTLTHPMVHMLTLTSLVFEGVPAKFPDLDFVMLESGLGWVPFMMGRMNREYAERRWDAPLLEKSPEEYIRDNFYFGTQPLPETNNPAHMRSLLDIVGADSILFTTDHPHFDFDNPGAVMKYFNDMSKEERRKVLGGNAIEIFNLDI